MTPDLPNKICLINYTIFLRFQLSCLHNLKPDTFGKLSIQWSAAEVPQAAEASADWGAETKDWGASEPAVADWGAKPTGNNTDWGAGDASAGWN